MLFSRLRTRITFRSTSLPLKCAAPERSEPQSPRAMLLLPTSSARPSARCPPASVRCLSVCCLPRSCSSTAVCLSPPPPPPQRRLSLSPPRCPVGRSVRQQPVCRRRRPRRRRRRGARRLIPKCCSDARSRSPALTPSPKNIE